MAFKGRFSRGCGACRKRKVRCDQREGGCKNCQRLRRVCPGYRNELDLLFFDETSSVERKYSGCFEFNSEQQILLFNTRGCDANSTSIIGDLTLRFGYPTVDDFALSYCYYRHVLPPDRTSNVRIVVRDSKLLCCMKALGMASFSTIVPSAEVVNTATRYYVQAIRLTNEALMSSEGVTHDCTLLAVIMLSLYESVIGGDISSMQAWAEHVRGTAAILEMRGVGQMSTPAGRFLYVQATTLLMTRCWARGGRLPSGIRMLLADLFNNVEDPSDPRWKDFSAKLQLVNLRADVLDLLSDSPYEIIQRALQLDAQYQYMFIQAEAAFAEAPTQPEAESTLSFEDDSYQRRQHNYAPVRNSMISGRIQCNLIILVALERLGADHVTYMAQSQYAESRRIIEELQTEFLASLPAQLIPTASASSGTQITLENSGQGKAAPNIPVDFYRVANLAVVDLPVLKTLRSNMLLRQLTLVGGAAEPGSIIRVATCDALRVHGESIGLRQAQRLADFLEKDTMCQNGGSYWIKVLFGGKIDAELKNT